MGESFPLTDIFQRGWNHQPVKANINNQQGWSHLFCWMRRCGWTYWNTQGNQWLGTQFFGYSMVLGETYSMDRFIYIINMRKFYPLLFVQSPSVVIFPCHLLFVYKLVLHQRSCQLYRWLYLHSCSSSCGCLHILFLWHIPTARWPCSVSPSSINMSRLGIVCWHSYHPWLLPIPQRFGPRNYGAL